MDIELRTHDSENRLELRGIYPEDDCPVFRARIVVRSDGFGADRPLSVERDQVVEFLEALEGMDRTLGGEARLQPFHELDYISFRMATGGHVVVTGELGYSATNYLKFEFLTDQTCLGPLVEDLRRLLQTTAGAV